MSACGHDEIQLEYWGGRGRDKWLSLSLGQYIFLLPSGSCVLDETLCSAMPYECRARLGDLHVAGVVDF